MGSVVFEKSNSTTPGFLFPPLCPMEGCGFTWVFLFGLFSNVFGGALFSDSPYRISPLEQLHANFSFAIGLFSKAGLILRSLVDFVFLLVFPAGTTISSVLAPPTCGGATGFLLFFPATFVFFPPHNLVN